MALLIALPEGNRLGSYLLLSLQVANVVPAAAMVRGPPLLRLESVIWLLLLGGFAICQLMSFFWSYTTTLANGLEHSVSLLLLTFLAGCVNNTSSLYLYPFVARWDRRNVSALATGEGLSGILVSLIALAQNVGGAKPNFSVLVYFQCVSAMYLFTFVSFVFLLREQQRHQAARRTTILTGKTGQLSARATAAAVEADAEAEAGSSFGIVQSRPATTDGHNRLLLLSDEDSLVLPLAAAPSSSVFLLPPTILHLIWPYLLVQFVSAAWAYGVIPALIPIATTGYEHQPHVMQFSSFVSMALDPLSRALTHFVRLYRLGVPFVFVNVFAGLVVVAAILSPRPPFDAHPLGGAFVIVCNGAFTASFAFCSTMVYYSIHKALGKQSMGTSFQSVPAAENEDVSTPTPRGEALPLEQQHEEQVGKWQEGFRWSSFVIQLGAFLGSLLTFLLLLK